MHSPCSGARGSGVPILLADARALEEPRRYADADASHDEEGRLPHVKAAGSGRSVDEEHTWPL